MDHRRAASERKTRETDIYAEVDLDGSGGVFIDTPIVFFSHMLEALGRHSLIDLTLRANGDPKVGQHHLVEDTGLVIGSAIAQALGDRRGISRGGWARYPMDEALADVAVDVGGRPHLTLIATFDDRRVGDLDVTLLHDFFLALARALGATFHIDLLRGRNDPHRVEAIFKGFARALRMALAREPRLAGKMVSPKAGGEVRGSFPPEVDDAALTRQR
jgi:imidazoleglycerol-phosphate dehydratase